MTATLHRSYFCALLRVGLRQFNASVRRGTWPTVVDSWPLSRLARRVMTR
jgi:hypothetical protein